MCDKAVEENSYLIEYIPDKFKTQEMCRISNFPSAFYGNIYKKEVDAYKKRKEQKALITELEYYQLRGILIGILIGVLMKRRRGI